MRFSTGLTAILLGSTFLSLAAWYLGSGFDSPFEAVRRTFEQRWKYVDGWAMLLEFAILGPTVMGPLILKYSNGALFQSPVLSGANLWVLMGIVLCPQLLLWLLGFLYGRMPMLALAGLAVWVCGMGLRLLTVVPVTCMVLAQTMFRQNAPRDIDGFDYCGIVLGLLWSIVTLWQVVSFFRYGLPS